MRFARFAVSNHSLANPPREKYFFTFEFYSVSLPKAIWYTILSLLFFLSLPLSFYFSFCLIGLLLLRFEIKYRNSLVYIRWNKRTHELYGFPRFRRATGNAKLPLPKMCFRKGAKGPVFPQSNEATRKKRDFGIFSLPLFFFPFRKNVSL